MTQCPFVGLQGLCLPNEKKHDARRPLPCVIKKQPLRVIVSPSPLRGRSRNKDNLSSVKVGW